MVSITKYKNALFKEFTLLLTKTYVWYTIMAILLRIIGNAVEICRAFTESQ